MQVSAELRWFWEKDCPDEVAGWFAGDLWASDPVSLKRSDEYFVRPGNAEIGCKLRGIHGVSQDNTEHSTELKAMLTRFERNRIELWGKWEWHIPANARSVQVHKDRQLRLCSTSGPTPRTPGELPLDAYGHPQNPNAVPDDACQIELTRLRVDGLDSQWWTLGLEAWGDLPSAPLVLARSLDMLNPPVGSGRLLNYPQFLEELLFSRQVMAQIEDNLIA